MQYYIIFAKDIAFKNFEMYSQIIASAVGLDDATLTLIFQVPLVTIVPFKFDGLHFKRWPRRWCQKNLFKEEYSYISIDYKNIENTNLLNIKENNNIVNKINVIFKKKENMKKIYI